MKRSAILLVVLVACLHGLFSWKLALAEDAQTDSLPVRSWSSSLDLAGGGNPATLVFVGEARYRNVYRLDKSSLWNDLYIQGGFQLSVTPAYAKAGMHIEWLPIAILQLRLQYDRYAFFAQHGSLLAYASGDEPFGDDVIKSRRGEEKTGSANRVLFQPALRMKYGSYIIRNKSDFALFEFSGKGPYYHEWEYDVLLKTDDRLLNNQFMLLYELIQNENGRTLLVGPYHEYLTTSHANLERSRAGLSLYFVPVERIRVFHQPRLWIQAGRYLQDRNRDNEIYFLAGVGADLKFE